MVTFGQWLLFDDIKVEIYEASIRDLMLQQALEQTLEFYNNSVAGRWSLILESDGESLEADDPFTGSEDAKPVEVTPDDKKIKRARKIQRLAKMVRWAAMLDRRDAIAEVQRIYRQELLPILSRKEQTPVKESWHDESDFPMLPDFESKPATPQQQQTKPNAAQGSSGLSGVIKKLRPLLEKLGYLEEGELDYGTEDEKIKVISRAAEAASAEVDNDPPEEPEVVAMAKDEGLRKSISENMMGELIRILTATAEKTYRLIRRKYEFEGKELQAAEFDESEILSKGLEDNMRKLQRRKVNKDGTARPWDDELSIMTINIDSDEAAAKLINTIKSPISTPERALRDERRARDRAAGLGPGSGAVFTCSQCGHTRSAAYSQIGTTSTCPKCGGEGKIQQGASAVSYSAGTTNDDGSVSSMDPVDTKTRDSLTASADRESGNAMVSAFKQAMKELREKSPTMSAIACIWLSLDCEEDGSIPETNIERFVSAAGGVTMSSRMTPAQFINSLALDAHVPEKVRGRGGLGGWKLVELIVQRDLPRVGPTLSMRPNGSMPSVLPTYSMVRNNPKSLTPSQMDWWNFYNNANDAKGKAISFVVQRMNDILMEQSDELALGQENAHSWNLHRFLSAVYRDQVRSGHAVINQHTTAPRQEVTIEFYDAKKKRVIKSFRLKADGIKVSVVQEQPKGFENNVFNYTIPEAPPGQAMDSKKLKKLEWDVKARLDKRQLNR